MFTNIIHENEGKWDYGTVPVVLVEYFQKITWDLYADTTVNNVRG